MKKLIVFSILMAGILSDLAAEPTSHFHRSPHHHGHHHMRHHHGQLTTPEEQKPVH